MKEGSRPFQGDAISQKKSSPGALHEVLDGLVHGEKLASRISLAARVLHVGVVL